MLEGRHNNATRTSRHALHVAKYERRCDGVSLAGTAATDNYCRVGTDELCETLRGVEVNLFILLHGL